jgi:hypothetical protein
LLSFLAVGLLSRASGVAACDHADLYAIPGQQKVKFKSSFVGGTVAAMDAINNGATFTLYGAGGGSTAYSFVPGAFAGYGTKGWKVSASGRALRYLDRTGPPSGPRWKARIVETRSGRIDMLVIGKHVDVSVLSGSVMRDSTPQAELLANGIGCQSSFQNVIVSGTCAVSPVEDLNCYWDCFDQAPSIIDCNQDQVF